MAPTLSADAFAALARSSPWRWSTLRFTVGWPADRWKPGVVRAWVRRPDAQRVETPAGALIEAGRTPRPTAGLFGSGRGRSVVLSWVSDPGAPAPALRPDGLVDRRPHDLRLSYDGPMYRDYHWVAMLDPVELADGNGSEDGLVDPLSIDSVAEVEHGGRRAWEAIVDPTPEYEPRCGCCPLLRSFLVDQLEYGSGSEHVLEEYPEAYRVRLDVETGVCVLTEEVGGLTPGKGHDLRIEAVDERLDDDLFVPPRRPPLSGWSVGPGRVE